MPYSAAAIANYFLDLAEQNNTTLDPMKVQKLVYFAHGWNLAINGLPLIDEQVEAWKFGPVIRSLYRDLRSYGRDTVTDKIRKMIRVAPDDRNAKTFSERMKAYRYTAPTVGANDADTQELLDQLWGSYSHFTGIQLSNLTHAEGSPWDQVMKENGGSPPKGTDIPSEMIKEYFMSEWTETAGRKVD